MTCACDTFLGRATPSAGIARGRRRDQSRRCRVQPLRFSAFSFIFTFFFFSLVIFTRTRAPVVPQSPGLCGGARDNDARGRRVRGHGEKTWKTREECADDPCDPCDPPPPSANNRDGGGGGVSIISRTVARRVFFVRHAQHSRRRFSRVTRSLSSSSSSSRYYFVNDTPARHSHTSCGFTCNNISMRLCGKLLYIYTVYTHVCCYCLHPYTAVYTHTHTHTRVYRYRGYRARIHVLFIVHHTGRKRRRRVRV